MSTSHFGNHRSAAELHDLAAQAHQVAHEHGHQDYLTGSEHSRQALEHSAAALQQTSGAAHAHGIATFGHAEIAARAYEIWQSNGSPKGTATQDWERAAHELRARAVTTYRPSSRKRLSSLWQ